GAYCSAVSRATSVGPACRALIAVSGTATREICAPVWEIVSPDQSRRKARCRHRLLRRGCSTDCWSCSADCWLIRLLRVKRCRHPVGGGFRCAFPQPGRAELGGLRDMIEHIRKCRRGRGAPARRIMPESTGTEPEPVSRRRVPCRGFP